MTPVREQADRTPSEDDVAYLCAALKPFDPADRPFTAVPTHRRSDAETERVPTAPHGLLVATAAAVIAAVLVPALVLDRTPHPVPPQRNAGQDLADCRQRAAAGPTEDLTTGGANTPGMAPRPSLLWYSPTKAAQLTAVLRKALPAESCVFPGSGFGDLRFTDDSRTSFSTIGESATPAPAATGPLVTSVGNGSLMVSVYPAPAGSGSCVSGNVDHQFTATDGTVVNQTFSSANDETTRWIVLLVQAHRSDGSCVWLRQSDEVLRHDIDPNAEGTIASGATPLTMNELTALATTPGLDTTS